MAAPARLISLNIGSQTIGLAEFRETHAGLVLLNHGLREISADPDSDRALWLQQKKAPRGFTSRR
jgi:hypothetical protein